MKIFLQKKWELFLFFFFFFFFFSFFFFFFFDPKLTSKLMSVRRFTKFGPMIHFTCPTTHIRYIYIALYPFFHARWILVWALWLFFVARKSKSMKCVFATFSHPVCETGVQITAILKHRFITCYHRKKTEVISTAPAISRFLVFKSVGHVGILKWED